MACSSRRAPSRSAAWRLGSVGGRMCGRYTLTTTIGKDLADRFAVRDAAALAPATRGRFNVCPTERIAVVTDDRTARGVRWGLVPPWARELGKGLQPINARSETAATRQPFAALLPRAD